jgi:uncharacterized protein YegP (UPF0339 family)
MTANEFGAEGHFVIVRRRNLRSPRQQWHFQWRSNYRTIAWSEKYSSREAALAGIRTLPGGTEWLENMTPLDVDLRAGKR